MNLEELRAKHKKPIPKMRYTIGNQVHFVLLDFQKYKKKFKHDGTEYLLYECKIISRNHIEMDGNRNHHIQIPIKNAWTKIYDQLKAKNRLKDKDINITITRKTNDNYNFDITIHNT